MNRIAEVKVIDAQIASLKSLAKNIERAIKEVKKHRRKHLLGKTDRHCRYHSVADHVQELTSTMCEYIKDLQDVNKEIDDKYSRLVILYKWDDTEE